jgi:PAS domain S-box-containing protein
MKSKILYKKTWISFVILMTGIALTIAAFVYTKNNQETALKKEFHLVCSDIKTIISTRLHAHALLLRSGASYIEGSENVTREKWHIYIESLKISKNLPGIEGVGFAEIIKKDQLKEHIRQIRKEGFADYSVRPAGERAVYTSIIYLEPFAGRNLRAFGFDMYSEPVRRKAMDQACDQNLAALSAKVVLVQESDQKKQIGTLMYVPVYEKGMPINTIDERRAAIRGWVYSPYRMDDLMKGILGRWDLNNISKIHLRIFENDSVSQNSILFDSQKIDKTTQDDETAQTFTIPIVFNEKEWTLQFTDSILQFPYLQSKVLLVLISGFIISILLFYLSLLLMNTRIRAQQIANELTSQLKESEARFTMFMDQLPAIVFIKDHEGKALFVNHFLDNALGASKWLGKDMFEVFPNEIGAKFLEDDMHVLKLGYKKIEESMMLLDGKVHYFETQKFTIPQQGQKPLLGGIALDITDRKLSELALKESEAKYHTLADNTQDIINRFDRNYKHLYASPSAYRLSGINHLDYIGKSHRDLGFSSEDCDFWENCIQTVFDSGKTHNQLIEFEGKTGKVYLDWLLSPEFDDENNIVSVLGNIRDITEIKKTEVALYEERQRLSGIIKGTNVATWEWNIQTGETIFNERWAEIIGFTLEEISPVSIDTWLKFAHPDDNKSSNKLLEKHFRGELDYYVFETRMKHKNGNWVWVLDSGMVTSWTDDGKPLLMMGSHLDINERKLVEEELKVSREQLRDFAAHLQKVREDERLSITLEIHDSLAQFLVAQKMEMGMYKKKISKSLGPIQSAEILAEMEQFITLTDNAIKSARKIMNGLRPEQLELLGFVETAEVLLRDFEESHHLKCQFIHELSGFIIHPEHALALFRTLQESLNNILKHAMATSVIVQLTTNTHKLILEIIDNGVGFDINNCGRADSFGLIGMKELAKMHNGILEINSKVGEGTQVRVELPI